MELRKALSQLKESTEFTSFEKEYPGAFLSHCFLMNGMKDQGWNIGYQLPDGKAISFHVEKETIEASEPSEVFKHPDTVITPLVIDDLGITESDAFHIGETFMKEKYSAEQVTKEMLHLQHNGENQVFMITYLTYSMNTISVHINAKDGEILKDTFTRLMDIARFDSGEDQQGASEKKE